MGVEVEELDAILLKAGLEMVATVFTGEALFGLSVGFVAVRTSRDFARWRSKWGDNC